MQILTLISSTQPLLGGQTQLRSYPDRPCRQQSPLSQPDSTRAQSPLSGYPLASLAPVFKHGGNKSCNTEVCLYIVYTNWFLQCALVKKNLSLEQLFVLLGFISSQKCTSILWSDSYANSAGWMGGQGQKEENWSWSRVNGTRFVLEFIKWCGKN